MIYILVLSVKNNYQSNLATQGKHHGMKCLKVAFTSLGKKDKNISEDFRQFMPMYLNIYFALPEYDSPDD